MKCFTTVHEAATTITRSAQGRQNYDDSFWICDLAESARLYQSWSTKMPRARPYYAVKAAPHPPFVKMLLMLGAGVDCASKGEIDLALEMGATADDIIYSNTNKQISHLLHAKRHHINLMTYDCEEELRKISIHYPEARLLLRLKGRIEDEKDLAMNDRFGANLSRSKHLLRLSKELELKTIGISFHVGTACLDKTNYTSGLQQARELFDYALTIGLQFEMLNIGGGFEGTQQTFKSFSEITTEINRCLDVLFSQKQFPELLIIAEPGRYFAESTFSLVTNIIAKKDNEDTVDYTQNDGVCGSFYTTAAIDHHGDKNRIVIPLQDKSKEEVNRWSKLYGPTSSGFDVIKYLSMPNLIIGDWLLWPECGAYTFALSTNFNGFTPGTMHNIVTQKNSELLNEECRQYIATL